MATRLVGGIQDVGVEQDMFPEWLSETEVELVGGVGPAARVRKAQQPDGVQPERTGDRKRVGGTELTLLEDQPNDRLGEHDEPKRSRHRKQDHEAGCKREGLAKAFSILFRRGSTQGGKRGYRHGNANEANR